MISRILLSLLLVAIALTSTTACGQTVCPNEEILIFGSAFGYTTTLCNKDGKKCEKTASSTIVFYHDKIAKTGCAKAPNCESCAAKLPKSDAKAKGNFVYGGRQIFLDTTDGVSKLGNLQFAMVEGDRSDTHYAVFEVSVVYNLEGKDPVFFACPIALQLPGDPGIPDPLSAVNKTVEGETQLIVTDGKKETSFKIVESRGSFGVVKTKLLRTLDKNPVPPAPKPAKRALSKRPTPAKPTPAKPRRRVTPVEDK